ncbi:MAG TPA: AmmeMemoRadiSam system protein B [Candidatus Acidoferrales bacterium]|jgi:MEMO1 family protein|nr:AmmeMemoRadiSam system protein B [Candidatus Acidoferrales bacterium]
MLRLPAVAGQFYPGNPQELSSLLEEYTKERKTQEKVKVRASLVPHAGYMYSGAVAGAVFARIFLPPKILLLGVRHHPRGEALAILSEGAWRTPLGDVPVEASLAARLRAACPALREDAAAHSREHSLEVELPFLQLLDPGFSFVPIVIGTLRYDDLRETGEGIARTLQESSEDILIVTSSDMNHYEDDETTRRKDRKAIDCMLNLDPKALFKACRDEEISMCGLGPAIAMLTAMNHLDVAKAGLIRYATSADVSGNRQEVVGYAGMIFG